MGGLCQLQSTGSSFPRAREAEGPRTNAGRACPQVSGSPYSAHGGVLGPLMSLPAQSLYPQLSRLGVSCPANSFSGPWTLTSALSGQLLLTWQKDQENLHFPAGRRAPGAPGRATPVMGTPGPRELWAPRLWATQKLPSGHLCGPELCACPASLTLPLSQGGTREPLRTCHGPARKAFPWGRRQRLSARH